MDQIKLRVLSVMKNDAVPIYVIAKEAGISLATASKYCHILQAERLAEITKFGNMKMVRRSDLSILLSRTEGIEA